MALKVWITWALLIGIILYNVRSSFTGYHADKQLWKLILHTVLLFIFCIMNLQMGLYCLDIQSYQNLTAPVHRVVPAKHNTPAGHKPAVTSKVRKTEKK